MAAPLLSRLGWLPGLLLFWLLLALAPVAQATHLLGGEMTYRYLDANGPIAAPLRYEITIAVYNNCNAGAANPATSANVGIYLQGTGAQVILTATNYAGTLNAGRMVVLPTSITACSTVPVPPGCINSGAAQQPYKLQKFIATVNLPRAAAGYYAFWSSSARNGSINNLLNPGNAALALYTSLAPEVYANHSPVFANEAVAVLCANDTTTLLNNAVDADGDRLAYSFGQPYGQGAYPTTFTPPPTTTTYLNGTFSATAPLGAAPNLASLNASTGIAKFYAVNLGNQYVVAIDVKEYRTVNGVEVLIGTTRRDLQLVVGQCPPTAPPVLPTAAGSATTIPRNFTIEAGGTLTIPLTSTQADGHDLDLTATSVLLDGAGGYNATFAGNPGTLLYTGSPLGAVLISGTAGTVSGTFVYSPGCNEARATPYDVTLTVLDKGCAGKTNADVLHITVTKPTGPTAIAGNAAVCGLNTQHTYTASGGTAPGVSWRLSGGGSFVSGNTGSAVQVLWATAGTYTLTVRGVGQYGCLTDSVTKTVVVMPAPTLTVTGNLSICQGGSTSIAVAGGGPYTVSGGAVPLTGAGPFTLAPTQTTTYTIAGATVSGGCTPTTQATVVVNALPVATAGPAVRTCSGAPVAIGTAAVAGLSYSWSPATGLSSATAANPTTTLTNATSAPIAQTYTLTVTNANNCVNTSTVAVTVNPLPVAVPGAAVAFCAGGTGQLGAAAVAGYTYSWSPTTGLSDPTLANPTVTLPNPTGTASTQTYTLTVTNSATTCTSTGTVAVTVNPLPVAAPGTSVSFCVGSAGQLGAAAVAGCTYSWSPATGLSSSTVANPTVTLPNATGAPLTQTYILTVTSAAGCTSTGTVAATVNPLPAAVPGAAVTSCSGSPAQLGAAPVAGLSYSWSPATGLSSATVANPTATLTNSTSAATTQTYTLTVTGAGGCARTGTVAVTVLPAPVAIAGAARTICSGNTTQLGTSAVAGFSYSWSPATGLSNPSLANPTLTLTNVSPTGTALTPTYTLTVTNPATGCTNTSSVVVTVNAEILPGIVGPSQTVCASSVPVPLASTTAPSGGYGTYAYQWESSPDNLTWTTVPGATAATYAPGPLVASIYYRRRITSGSCAEQVSNSVKLELQPQLLTGVALATPATQCAGTALTFTPVPTNAGPAPTFRWYVNNTLVATSPTYTNSTLGNGDVVRVEVVPTAGFCATSLAVASVTINLTPVTRPTVRIKSQTVLPACSGTAVVLAVDSIGSPGSSLAYQWQVDGVRVSGATSPTFMTSTLRDGQVVTLLVTTPSACGPLTVVSNQLPVSIIQNVELSAGPNKTIMEGDLVELEGTANGTYPVAWTPSQTLTFPGNNQLRPMAAPTVTTTYTLSAKVGYCASASNVTITVTPRVRIPNAFSPNGDGLDDAWEIDRIAEYPGSHVIVFNRWGIKLFETTGYSRSNQWNGTINGQAAPLGTYYYLITLGNGKSYTGPLTVVY